MKNWIKPIKTTIKKYKALKKFIITGEYNKILLTGCALCEKAVKKNPDVNKCHNCIYYQLFHNNCMNSINFEIVDDLYNYIVWQFGDLINHQNEVKISLTLGKIFQLKTKEELLKKLESRIEFLNNMLEEVKNE